MPFRMNDVSIAVKQRQAVLSAFCHRCQPPLEPAPLPLETSITSGRNQSRLSLEGAVHPFRPAVMPLRRGNLPLPTRFNAPSDQRQVPLEGAKSPLETVG
jgi:hypothetical protein